jgi:hypothetical protein
VTRSYDDWKTTEPSYPEDGVWCRVCLSYKDSEGICRCEDETEHEIWNDYAMERRLEEEQQPFLDEDGKPIRSDPC